MRVTSLTTHYTHARIVIERSLEPGLEPGPGAWRKESTMKFIEAIENNTVRKYGFESKITILVFTLTEKIRKATGNLDTTF